MSAAGERNRSGGEPAVEAQARRYLRVFPAWVRSTRGEEAVGLVLDQVPADATRLPMRARVDLVRTGLQQHRRELPPPSVWWTVDSASSRSLGSDSVPARWHPWLLHLTRPRWCLLRHLLRIWTALALPVVVLSVAAGGRDGLPGSWLATSFSISLVWSVLGDWRRVVLERNGYEVDGRPLPPGARGQRVAQASFPNMPVRPLADSLAGSVALVSLLAIFVMVGWPKPGVDLSDHVRAATVGLVAASIGLVLAHRRTSRIERTAVQGNRAPLSWTGERAAIVWVLLALAPVVVLMVAAESELGMLVVMAANAYAIGQCLGVRRIERRVGGTIGLWDVVPGAAPHAVWTEPVRWHPPGPGSPTPF